MSRVAVPTLEPVNATPRARMTPARRRAVIERQGPLCAVSGCCRPIEEIDHVVPLELGGLDTLDNLAGLCKPCHLFKTRRDLATIGKVRRLLRRLDGTRRKRKPIPSPVKPWAKGQKLRSRGFPKTKSAQYLKGEG